MTGKPGESSEEPASPAQRETALSFVSIGRSAAILTVAAAVVQVIAVVREVFVAAQVGLSPDYDALLVALVIPTTFAGALTAGTVTALVPAYLEARAANGREDARRLVGAITFWVGICGLAVWLLLEAFGRFAIGIAGPGLDASSRDAAVGYPHIVAPLAFVNGIAAILAGICQAEERFKALATSSFAGSIATLTITLVLWQPLGLGAVALANLLGPVTYGSVLAVAAIRASIAPRLTVWTTRRELSAFVRHAGPLTLSSAILQVNGIVDRVIASLIGPGAVSALRYADVARKDADRGDQSGMEHRALSVARARGARRGSWSRNCHLAGASLRAGGLRAHRSAHDRRGPRRRGRGLRARRLHPGRRGRRPAR